MRGLGFSCAVELHGQTLRAGGTPLHVAILTVAAHSTGPQHSGVASFAAARLYSPTMPWFPILPNGSPPLKSSWNSPADRLPHIVGDPTYRARLAHPTVGAIALDTTMLDFVAHTAHRRATLPGFPASGVIAMEGAGRYIRFWLPDPKRPGILGETVYAWDTVEGKRTNSSVLQSSSR